VELNISSQNHDMKLKIGMPVIFQQDGTLPHFSVNVQGVLNSNARSTGFKEVEQLCCSPEF
jgi:hypothetical protein